MLKNKVVLITGGTGSFGQHVLKLFLEKDVREIRIFSRDEEKQEKMRSKLKNIRLKFFIGEVRSYDSNYQALKAVIMSFSQQL